MFLPRPEHMDGLRKGTTQPLPLVLYSKALPLPVSSHWPFFPMNRYFGATRYFFLPRYLNILLSSAVFLYEWTMPIRSSPQTDRLLLLSSLQAPLLWLHCTRGLSLSFLTVSFRHFQFWNKVLTSLDGKIFFSFGNISNALVWCFHSLPHHSHSNICISLW